MSIALEQVPDIAAVLAEVTSRQQRLVAVTPSAAKQRDTARRARATLEREGAAALREALDDGTPEFIAHLAAAASLDGQPVTVCGLLLATPPQDAA